MHRRARLSLERDPWPEIRSEGTPVPRHGDVLLSLVVERIRGKDEPLIDGWKFYGDDSRRDQKQLRYSTIVRNELDTRTVYFEAKRGDTRSVFEIEFTREIIIVIVRADEYSTYGEQGNVFVIWSLAFKQSRLVPFPARPTRESFREIRSFRSRRSRNDFLNRRIGFQIRDTSSCLRSFCNASRVESNSVLLDQKCSVLETINRPTFLEGVSFNDEKLEFTTTFGTR